MLNFQAIPQRKSFRILSVNVLSLLLMAIMWNWSISHICSEYLRITSLMLMIFQGNVVVHFENGEIKYFICKNYDFRLQGEEWIKEEFESDILVIMCCEITSFDQRLEFCSVNRLSRLLAQKVKLLILNEQFPLVCLKQFAFV